MGDADIVSGAPLVAGRAQGPLLWTDTGLSFWGGVDPASGRVVDRHHPLCGAALAGRVLALPSGRGSCSGSGVLLELILNGLAPAAIVVCEPEDILTLGALVGEAVFARSLPVLRVAHDAFASLAGHPFARVDGPGIALFDADPGGFDDVSASAWNAPEPTLRLEPGDKAMLSGQAGRAAQTAMHLIVRMAALQGAEALLDVSQVHIDGCVYTGPATLRFALWMRDNGARTRVPTTMNAISVDHRRWRELGVPETLGAPATALADAYLAMGAKPTFTCAPYLLDTAPGPGEHVGWAESNAVVYANSVLGARTAKYPDFLDLCIALTGRAPRAGCHTDSGRRATLRLDVDWPEGAYDLAWPLLGYACGLLGGGAIPLLCGLEEAGADSDDLKAFGAAFATTSAAPMFHIAGVTPEAEGQTPTLRIAVGREHLRQAWEALNTADEPRVDLVSLGNPHFSATEFARLAALCQGRRKSPAVAVTITCGRAVQAQAAAAGSLAAVEAFGATVITDTCWCMLGEPVVPTAARTVMTNSGKYAHYAPGLVGRRVRFGSLAECVEAACTGESPRRPAGWLGESG